MGATVLASASHAGLDLRSGNTWQHRSAKKVGLLVAEARQGRRVVSSAFSF